MTIRINAASAAWDELARQYRDVAPGVVEDEGVALATESVEFLERQVVLGLPENSGRLKQGVVSGVDVTPSGSITGYVGVEGPASQYVWPVDLGAKPHWAPLDPLIQWIKDKNLSWVDAKGRAMTVRSMAFVLQRAISLRGTIARFGATLSTPAGDGEIGGAHAGRNALVQGEGVLAEIVDRHAATLARRLSELFGGKP